MFQSTKIVDGFSTCFRQWKAEETHCKFLHGYGIYFKITFEGELDDRNWIFDFGGFKRSKVTIKCGENEMTPNEWFSWWFDHTTVIAFDDPEKEKFMQLYESGIIKLRILPKVGCEMFAKYVFDILSEWLHREIGSYRVKIKSVECFEHAKNSAIYAE